MATDGSPPAWADATEGVPAIMTRRATVRSRETMPMEFSHPVSPGMECRCSPGSGVRTTGGMGGRLAGF